MWGGNDNGELAVSWVFENSNNPDPFQPMPVPKPAAGHGSRLLRRPGSE